VEGSEVDGPDAISHLLEANEVPAQEAAHENLAVLPPDGGVLRDPPDLEVAWVLDRIWPARIGTSGGQVNRSRRFLAQRFVGPLEVVDASEAVEPSLLGAEVRAGWRGGALLEGSMHALVAAVLVRLSGLDELGGDAEGDPPHGELGEASDGGGGEGMAVVGADPLGEAQLPEQMFEAPDGGLEIEPEHASAVQEEAGVAVLDREREAEAAVSGPELTFEVGAPGGVGFVHGPHGWPRMGAAAPGLSVLHASAAEQDAMDRIDGRDGVELVPQLSSDLGSSPATVLADQEDALDDVGSRRVGAGARSVRAVLQAFQPLLTVALEPFVAGGSADAVAAAELREGKVGELGFQDESRALGLHGGSSPWHRGLPVEGAPRLRGEL